MSFPGCGNNLDLLEKLRVSNNLDSRFFGRCRVSDLVEALDSYRICLVISVSTQYQLTERSEGKVANESKERGARETKESVPENHG